MCQSQGLLHRQLREILSHTTMHPNAATLLLTHTLDFDSDFSVDVPTVLADEELEIFTGNNFGIKNVFGCRRSACRSFIEVKCYVLLVDS